MEAGDPDTVNWCYSGRVGTNSCCKTHYGPKIACRRNDSHRSDPRPRGRRVGKNDMKGVAQ